MELGAFSISLAVKGLQKSQDFYERFGSGKCRLLHFAELLDQPERLLAPYRPHSSICRAPTGYNGQRDVNVPRHRRTLCSRSGTRPTVAMNPQ